MFNARRAGGRAAAVLALIVVAATALTSGGCESKCSCNYGDMCLEAAKECISAGDPLQEGINCTKDGREIQMSSDCPRANAIGQCTCPGTSYLYYTLTPEDAMSHCSNESSNMGGSCQFKQLP